MMRKLPRLLVLVSLVALAPATDAGVLGQFNTDRDLFLPQFDCKTDVDDLHSVAAVATMLRDERFAGVDYHAVAGAYGMQDGLYVPGEDLFKLAFGESWSDAHNDYDAALSTVAGKVISVLRTGGSVWVADGGQSDFTAAWLARAEEELPEVDLRDRVHVVQHADWNEEVTTPEKLAYLKRTASYHKIPDGNATGNGTPGLRSESPDYWPRATALTASGELWELAQQIGERYNGADGRYENPAVTAGGIDFSDTAETCWIFGFDGLFDAESFFETFSEASGE
jgi:hypothetical protein